MFLAVDYGRCCLAGLGVWGPHAGLLLLTSLLAATVGALAVGAGAGPARAAATVLRHRD